MESFLSLFKSTRASFTHVVHKRILIQHPEQNQEPTTKPKFMKHYYQIPLQFVEQFYDLYLETIKNSNCDEFVYVCEYSPTYSHLLFDLDFNFASSDADVSEDQVAIIIKLLEAGIRKYAPNMADISCIVLKRAYAIKKIVSEPDVHDNTKNKKIEVYRRGLHLHFPLVLSHYKLASMIKRDIMRYLDTEWNSKFFDVKHVNTLDNIIDDHIFCERTLQLYKSTRPDHYKDNCYLPFVTTGTFKNINYHDDLRVLKLLSKYNDVNRFTNESLVSTMCMIDVLDSMNMKTQSATGTGYDRAYDQEYEQAEYEQAVCNQ